MRNRGEFEQFLSRVRAELLGHRVVVENPYCEWFATGEASVADVRHFTQQFSVFSNMFLIAQLLKTINARTLAEARQSKEILANEIGVVFRRRQEESESSAQRRRANAEEEGDPSLVNTEGTVDGGRYRFKAAHFEWLVRFAEPLGLAFDDLGKRRHGTATTLHFCDELARIYGNPDFNIGAGASFAVENWAAAGFWKQLIAGLRKLKESQVPNLHLGFFTWHDKVEDQHAEHTHAELEQLFFEEPEFDEETFIAAGKEMLDGVAVFWDGLNQDRLAGVGG